MCFVKAYMCVCVCCIFELFNKKISKESQKTKTNSNTFTQSTKHKSVFVRVCVWSANTTNKIFARFTRKENECHVFFCYPQYICKFVVLLVMCVWVLNAVSVLSSKLRRASTGDGMFSKLFLFVTRATPIVERKQRKLMFQC